MRKLFLAVWFAAFAGCILALAPARGGEPAKERALFRFEDQRVTLTPSRVTAVTAELPAQAEGQGAKPEGTALHVTAPAAGGVAIGCDDFPRDWRRFAAVRFWVYRDEKYADSTTVIEFRAVEKDGQARFWRKLDLTHTGWKQIELPLAWFRWGDDRVPRWDRIERVVIFTRSVGEFWIDAVRLVEGADDRAAELSLEQLREAAFPGIPAHKLTLIRRPAVELLSDAPALDGKALADHLEKVAAAVAKDFAFLETPLPPGMLLVFGTPEDYRGFVPRLGKRWNAEAPAPTSGGFTTQAIALSSWSETHGTLRPVFAHEYVHSLLSRALLLPNKGEWLHEGLANMYQLRFHPQENLPAIIRDGVADPQKHLPLAKLCNGQAIPLNRYWQAVTVAELLLREPKYQTHLGKLIAAFQKDGSTRLEPHLTILETDWQSLEQDWRAYCKKTYDNAQKE